MKTTPYRLAEGDATSGPAEPVQWPLDVSPSCVPRGCESIPCNFCNPPLNTQELADLLTCPASRSKSCAACGPALQRRGGGGDR